MTAGTNVLLAVVCFLCVARWPAHTGERARMWRRFVIGLGVAALSGAAKHGFADYTATTWHQAITLASNLAAGATTYYAQRATLESGLFGPRSRRVLLLLVRLQVAIFALQVLLSPSFATVLRHSAMGLAGVGVAEWVAYRRRLVTSPYALAGIAAAVLPGIVYVLRWPSHLWFNHVDAAHVLMVGCCVLIYRAAQSASSPAVAS